MPQPAPGAAGQRRSLTRRLGPDELHALRQIPLPAILRTCGGRPDRYDRKKWHTAQGTLSVTGLQFMNWNRGCGGGGAIDLVMHLEDLDFPAAVAWLRQRFSLPVPVSSARPALRPLLLPAPDASQLSAVELYLVRQRALPQKLITALIQSGELYADARANAVFLLRGEEHQPVGAELRGTGPARWRGLAPGSRRDLGYFHVQSASPTSMVLCESAIDALSCYLLHSSCRTISTSGARADPPWLLSLLEQGLPIYCGFDADPAGDQQAQLMMALHPKLRRLRPTHHDWNDVLHSVAAAPMHFLPLPNIAQP
ncbi:MAG: hypothetical protein DMG69_32665 [Acidobacteria bacterium]|nr:MAG: hypothetical protein DMG69_32665 [Acidobacteriota bacterium]